MGEAKAAYCHPELVSGVNVTDPSKFPKLVHK
jgi:hypothetical protein